MIHVSLSIAGLLISPHVALPVNTAMMSPPANSHLEEPNFADETTTDSSSTLEKKKDKWRTTSSEYCTKLVIGNLV